MNSPRDIPLVALCVPCGDRVHQEFMQCIWALGRGARNHRQGLASAQNSIIPNGRNNLVEAARQMKADYAMFLDSDMTFPYKIVDELLAHNKDIVGCNYVRRGPPFDNLGVMKDKSLHGKEVTGLHEMDEMPTGLLLIKMSVFDKFKAPIFRTPPNEETGKNDGEDLTFCRMAREKGFSVWCDVSLSMECAHLYQYGLRPTDPAVRKMNKDFSELGLKSITKNAHVNGKGKEALQIG